MRICAKDLLPGCFRFVKSGGGCCVERFAGENYTRVMANGALTNIEQVQAGTKRLIEGKWRVFYEGYWVKMYDVPADTLQAKKRLIEALTRRLFNHVEHGINIPGIRLDEARQAYELETHPQRKRVKGAMLAGCLFNRAADVFTKLVELQAIGAAIHTDNSLMRQCEEHL